MYCDFNKLEVRNAKINESVKKGIFNSKLLKATSTLCTELLPTTKAFSARFLISYMEC